MALNTMLSWKKAMAKGLLSQKEIERLAQVALYSAEAKVNLIRLRLSGFLLIGIIG